MKLLTYLVLLFTVSLAHAGVDVIVHPSNGATLDAGTIKKIFTGKSKSFPDGSKAIPLTQVATAAATGEFNDKVLSKSASQLKAHWSKLVFTGKGTPPKEAANDAEVLSLVASNPNIIGFVTSGSADGSVKVVQSF